MKHILVGGSSGQIGTHLCRKLESEGNKVVGIDIEYPIFYEPSNFELIDCRRQDMVDNIFNKYGSFDEVYILNARMGGMAVIGDEKWSYDIMVGSTEQIANILDNCVKYYVKKVFYSSSACVYPEYLQDKDNDVNLKESDIYPSQPDLIYGWQKITGEKMCEAARITHGLDVKVARFHNIFATEIDYTSNRTKAPAALSYKVAKAKDGEEIEVWGDGTARRSFLWIDECLEGIQRLMASNYDKPLNIGSDESISINNLAQMIIDISGKDLKIKNVKGNVGVQSRNSDNTLCEQVLGWRPNRPLKEGIEKLYNWIEKKVSNG